MDMTLSALLGAATMNNTFCLAIFLGLVYIRDLSWAFSAEVRAPAAAAAGAGAAGCDLS